MADDKDDIVTEARKRFERAKSFYGPSRVLAVADTRFALGDSDNGWQWPDDISQERTIARRVKLTVNTTAQHCNQVINEIRKNRPACKVSPVDGGADKKTADILSGLIRNIQASSNADDAHDIAAEHATYGGEGYWRVLTDYESETSFDQYIAIAPIPNPNRVYIDPDAKALDKSDAEWGFIFSDISKEQFKRDYPGIDPASWVDDRKGWIDNILSDFASYGVSYTWVGPAAWKEDKGIINIMGDRVGPHFFSSEKLTLARAKDNMHPSNDAARVWMDSVAVFMRKTTDINFRYKTQGDPKISYSPFILLQQPK